MNKLITIQWLRAIAALMVVWVHAMSTVKFQMGGSFDSGLDFLAPVGGAGVDVFFVISGFIVYLSATRAGSVGGFLTDRFLRIWPIYAIATVAYLIVNPDAGGEIGRVIPSLLFLQPIGVELPLPTLPPGWSLMFEAGFYGVLAFALAWRSGRPLAERVGIIVAGLVLLGAVAGYPRPLNVLGNPLALEFLFGIAIAYVWQRRPTFPRWALAVMLGVGVMLLLLSPLYSYRRVADALSVLGGPVGWERVRVWGFAAALLISAAVFRPQTARPGVLSFLGDASYSIYLFHMHALVLMGGQWHLFAGMASDTAVLVFTCAAAGFGVLMYVLIERPMMRAVRGRGGAIRAGVERWLSGKPGLP